MKVYDLPAEVPAPEVDYREYDFKREGEKQEEHTNRLIDWLKAAGYSGKNTGKIVSFQVADGHASYMLAEGKTSALIHLPYGDAYEYRDVNFLPKKEILRRIEAKGKLKSIFGGK